MPCWCAVYVYGGTMLGEVLLCMYMVTPCKGRCCCVCWFRSQQTQQHHSQPLYSILIHMTISILTRHFSEMHFSVILQCMRISSKLHITFTYSGQNVKDFQFHDTCYRTHPSLLSHIFTCSSIASAWQLQTEQQLAFNCVKLSYLFFLLSFFFSFLFLFFFFPTFAHLLQRYVLKFFPSDSSPRVTATQSSTWNYKWTLTLCCEMNKAVFLHQGHSAVRTTCCTVAALGLTQRATEQQYAVWWLPVSKHVEMLSGQPVRTERWTQYSVMLLKPL